MHDPRLILERLHDLVAKVDRLRCGAHQHPTYDGAACASAVILAGNDVCRNHRRYCSLELGQRKFTPGDKVNLQFWGVLAAIVLTIWNVPNGLKFFVWYSAGMTAMNSPILYSWINSTLRESPAERGLIISSMMVAMFPHSVLTPDPRILDIHLDPALHLSDC